MYDPFEIQANETLSVVIEMDYEDRDGEKDFSIVAWGHDGKDGSLVLTHTQGFATSTFPTL